ncbi:unnamed protein product, partial [Urochloa humidicola]
RIRYCSPRRPPPEIFDSPPTFRRRRGDSVAPRLDRRRRLTEEARKKAWWRPKQLGMERLSLRPRGPRPGSYSPERTAASRDRPLSAPSAPPADATVVGRGLGSPPPQSQQEQELISGADSPPEIITAAENEKPGSSASPPNSLPSMDVNVADVPREWHSFSATSLDASIVGCGAHAPLQFQLKEESESGSDLD